MEQKLQIKKEKLSGNEKLSVRLQFIRKSRKIFSLIKKYRVKSKNVFLDNMFLYGMEQIKIIEMAKMGCNIKIMASAGSGKTTTSLAIAKEMPNKKFLLLTYNKILKEETRKRIRDYGINNIICHNYHSLAKALFGEVCHEDPHLKIIIDRNLDIATVMTFDILIIDEIQDMTELFYEFLIFAVAKLKMKPQLIILGDRYQTIFKYKGSDERFLLCSNKIFPFSERKWRRCFLKKSYRINIYNAAFINKVCLSADDKKSRIVSHKPGPKVKYLEIVDWYTDEPAQKIRELIEPLDPNDVFILTPSLRIGSPGLKIFNKVSINFHL